MLFVVNKLIFLNYTCSLLKCWGCGSDLAYTGDQNLYQLVSGRWYHFIAVGTGFRDAKFGQRLALTSSHVCTVVFLTCPGYQVISLDFMLQVLTVLGKNQYLKAAHFRNDLNRWMLTPASSSQISESNLNDVTNGACAVVVPVGSFQCCYF